MNKVIYMLFLTVKIYICYSDNLNIAIDGISDPTVGYSTGFKPQGQPAVFPGGTIMSDFNNNGSFTGYLVDEDYFADCSGGGGSTTNSVPETGESGIDFIYPEGYDGIPIYFSNNSMMDPYIVPESKRLYVLSSCNLGLYDEE